MNQQLLNFVPLIVLFVIFYFLLIRPQQKQAAAHKAMLAELKKGDKIITSGGFYAEVISVEDEVAKVRLGDNIVRIQKSAIASLASEPVSNESK